MNVGAIICWVILIVWAIIGIAGGWPRTGPGFGAPFWGNIALWILLAILTYHAFGFNFRI
jgi:hypothetical protein